MLLQSTCQVSQTQLPVCFQPPGESGGPWCMILKLLPIIPRICKRCVCHSYQWGRQFLKVNAIRVSWNENLRWMLLCGRRYNPWHRSRRWCFHLSRVVLEWTAAEFFPQDDKSPAYIELSDSPALASLCIGCSLSLQLSAWRGTVNDVFVLRSTFVLSWFLERHKQAWNLFCPPHQKKNKNGGIQVCQSTIHFRGRGRVNLIFVLQPCPVFSGSFSSRRINTSTSNWIEL